jgi:hypothetical protein
LIKYDGKTFKTFRHEPEKPNSLASNLITSIAVDLSGKIWIACFGSGLDRLDPVTNDFTHFRHDKADPTSLITDSVLSVMIDHTGNPGWAQVKGWKPSIPKPINSPYTKTNK